MTSKTDTDIIRQAAEDDLFLFAKLVNPGRMYGDVHEKLFRWWTRPDAGDHQLVLLPRDHQKSHCVAVRVAWWITKHPDTTILYLSATANLAIKQMKAIKDILTSNVYRRYWPEMVHLDEGKREQWTLSEISVDHPKRKEEGVRDPTVFAGGVGKNITGQHCNIAVLDDLVVPSNAYTADGRRQVAAAYSQLASVESTDSEEWVVGTRYDPRDLYSMLMGLEEEVYNPTTQEMVDRRSVYEVMEEVVELNGNFLWPQQVRADGKRFGFDWEQLARKKAKYVGDIEQFYAQYYNNPNSLETERINRSRFQYIEIDKVKQHEGRWHYKELPLHVCAAMDFAYTNSKNSDYTAIVVIGMDSDRNVYVLDIDRFKTGNISVYFEHLLQMYHKWEFSKVRCETNAGQSLIANDIKNEITKYGAYLSVDEVHRSRREGTKEERIASILDHRYQNQSIWHYRGGLCAVLEEELVMLRPKHDDIKDALASAIEIAVPPARVRSRNTSDNIVYHARFGGVAA